MVCKETPGLIVTDFSDKARFATEPGNSQNSVGSRAAGGALRVHVLHHKTELTKTRLVDELHRALRERQFIQYLVIIYVCQDINQGVTYS